jgi:glycosyltransferase involved in cell wall biosynthesis
VTRYLRRLIQALAVEHPDDEWRLFVPGRQELPGLGELVSLDNVVIRRHRVPGRVLFGAAAITGRPRLDTLVGGALDVLWAPTIAPLAVPRELPFVLTIQDLSFELRPQDFTAYERVWHRLARPRALARQARSVIVLAPPTREQLVARWGLDPRAVTVVAPGVHRPAGALEGVLERLGLARGAGYLLLARAFAAARAGGLEAQLVFAGDGRLAPQLAGAGIRVLGRVTDDELDALYAGALALVMPSLLEGYGLPVREALARGIPAIVSDLPVYGPELSGALLRVAPGDESALTQALPRIVVEDGLRARLAAAAAPAVADLTWEAAARRTRALLAQACDGSVGA